MTIMHYPHIHTKSRMFHQSPGRILSTPATAPSKAAPKHIERGILEHHSSSDSGNPQTTVDLCKTSEYHKQPPTRCAILRIPSNLSYECFVTRHVPNIIICNWSGKTGFPDPITSDCPGKTAFPNSIPNHCQGGVAVRPPYKRHCQ